MTSEEQRELDAQVAEQVMGWSDVNKLPGSEPTATNGMNPDGERGRVPAYSTDIADAWEVVNVIESRGYNVKYQTGGAKRVGPRVTIDESGHTQHGAAEDESAPIAICRVALQAVRSEKAQGA